jgi:hypothetical protein
MGINLPHLLAASGPRPLRSADRISMGSAGTVGADRAARVLGPEARPEADGSEAGGG